MKRSDGLWLVVLLWLPALGAMAGSHDSQGFMARLEAGCREVAPPRGCVLVPKTPGRPGQWSHLIIDTAGDPSRFHPDPDPQGIALEQAEQKLSREIGNLETLQDCATARQVLTAFAARGGNRASLARSVLGRLEARARFLALHDRDLPREVGPQPLFPIHQGISTFDAAAGPQERGGLASTPLPLPPGTCIGAGGFYLQFSFNEAMDRASRPSVTLVTASGYPLDGTSGAWADDRNFIVQIFIPKGQGNLVDGPIKAITITGAKDLAGNECQGAAVRLASR